MKTSKEYPLQDSDKVKITFHDVAAYFFEEEWKHLHQSQKELYTNVMQEVHQALISLGFQIINPNVLVRINKREDVDRRHSQEPEKTNLDSTSSCVPAACPDILLRIEKDEEISNRAEDDIISVIIKEEEEILDYQDSEERELSNTGQGAKNRKKTSGDSFKFTVTSKVKILHTPNKETHYTSLLLPERNGELGGEINNRCKKYELSNPAHSNVSQAPCKLEKSVKYQKCEHNKNKVNLFASQPQVHQHWQLYTCTECKKSFNLKENLLKHQKTHRKERPYHCTECEKTFSHKTHLKMHVRTHTGEKPYQCPECEKSFSQKGSLNVHIRKHTGEKPYQCSVCEKYFIHKYDLTRHERTHTGGRPYLCSKCEKCFSQRTHLLIHERAHSGERPYQCNECERNFGQRTHLVIHKRSHTGERPYHCNECEKTFAQKSNLIVHKRTHTCLNTLPHSPLAVSEESPNDTENDFPPG